MRNAGWLAIAALCACGGDGNNLSRDTSLADIVNVIDVDGLGGNSYDLSLAVVLVGTDGLGDRDRTLLGCPDVPGV